MKKKVLATMLAATMVATLFAGCGAKKDDSQANSESQKQEADEVTPLYHFALDGTDEGLVVVERDSDNPGANTGATHGIKESTKTIAYADGPVGKCAYFDGTYGIKLPMEDKIDGNTYTISFWINAERMGTFGPTLQLGHNIGMSDADNTVTWLNFTQCEWGANSAKLLPMVWARNSGNGIWPWIASYDDTVHGKKEWVMVTVVADGTEYEFEGDGTARIHAKFYLDGQLMTDSQGEEFDGYQGMAPDIFTASLGNFEAYLGINYWDSLFKGFMDEIYVYNKALTDEQVAKLFAEGNKSVSSVAGSGSTEEEEKNPEVTATGTLIGSTAFDSGFWTQFSDTFAVAKGETVKKTFKNYHGASAANWNNAFAVLQNVADAHAADANAAYKEYAVVRSDNYGWLGTNNTKDNLDALGWKLESDWNWDSFGKDTQGATVEIAVTNNGDTAEVVLTFTSAEGTTHFQKYSNIKVDGDVFFCLGVDNSVIDLQ